MTEVTRFKTSFSHRNIWKKLHVNILQLRTRAIMMKMMLMPVKILKSPEPTPTLTSIQAGLPMRRMPMASLVLHFSWLNLFLVTVTMIVPWNVAGPLGDLQVGAGDLQVGAGDLQVGAGDLQVSAGDLQAGRGDPQVGAGVPQVGAGDLHVGVGELQIGAGDLQIGLAVAIAKGRQQGRAKIKTMGLVTQPPPVQTYEVEAQIRVK